jgi:hypothetical protein
LLLQLKCAHLVSAKAPLPEEAIFNLNQAAAEKRRTALKAQHKKRQITKRDCKDDRNKRRKAGELGVSSDEDLSPEPSWSGDVASAAVDWSNISGSSSSSPLCGAEVSSSRRSREAGATRLWGRARVWWLPLLEWAFGRPAPVRRPAGQALPSRQDLRPVRSIPLGGRRSVRCLSANSTTVRIARTLTPCRCAGRGGGRQIRRRRQVRRRWQNRAPPRGACSRCLSGVAGPRMFMCPLSQVGATVQPRP